MPRSKKLLAVSALAVAAAVLSGVVASSARSSAAEYTTATVANATGCTSSRGTLKYGIAGAGISQLDPNTINFAGQAPLQTLLYNGIAKYDRNMQVVPDLATKWRSSKDLKTWFFTFRKDVKYATGRKFTAEDARANILRVLDPKVTSQQRANAKDIRSARVLNPYLLRIKLGSPSAILPNALVDIKMSDTENLATLANSGTVPLAIAVITVSGDFAQTNDCPASLPVGAHCTIAVTFAPAIAGGRSGVLSVFADAANSPQNVTLSGTGTAAPSPAPAPVAHTVAAAATGNGSVSPPGTTAYPTGTVATYTATAGAGRTFTGWTLDGQYVGYANPLTLTVDSNRTLVAAFVATPQFSDLGTLGAQDRQAVTFLAALGIVNPQGVNGSGQFQPGNDVKRAEVAAFVARTFGWQREFHRNTFPDRCDPHTVNCVDDELWNNVAALADYGVVGGYTDTATCASADTSAPCYLPRDTVRRVQIVSVVARAFIKTPDLRPTGFWDRQDPNPAQDTNVPHVGTQRADLTTYRANVGTVPGQTSDANFGDPTGPGSRLYVVQVLYAAFNAQFGTDRVP